MATPAHPNLATLPPAVREELSVLFLAKHARGSGAPDTVDGNHAVYHHELRTTLEAIGLSLSVADSYEALAEAAGIDFVFPLLNRAGFLHSEMLAPLLCQRRGLPFLGASAILRGLADDKHLTKLAARARGVPTMDWAIFRRGNALVEPRLPEARLVVKPNASSASWGVALCDGWREARDHIAHLHAEGHDAIVEPYAPLLDIAVPVVGGAGPEPWLLPPLAYLPDQPGTVRSYAEKRAIAGGGAGPDPLTPVEDGDLIARLERHSRNLAAEFWPFDYGRFEYRHDPATGRLLFMEVNLSCNLWSQKTISRSAATLGIGHAELVESILAHSVARQGLVCAGRIRLAA